MLCQEKARPRCRLSARSRSHTWQNSQPTSLYKLDCGLAWELEVLWHLYMTSSLLHYSTYLTQFHNNNINAILCTKWIRFHNNKIDFAQLHLIIISYMLPHFWLPFVMLRKHFFKLWYISMADPVTAATRYQAYYCTTFENHYIQIAASEWRVATECNSQVLNELLTKAASSPERKCNWIIKVYSIWRYLTKQLRKSQ